MSRPVIRTAAEIASEKAQNPSGRRSPTKRTHYNVGNCLKKLREDMKLSLADVANGCGVGSQTISAAEDGGDITVSRAMRLSAFYDRKFDEIWDGTETVVEHGEGEGSESSGNDSDAAA